MKTWKISALAAAVLAASPAAMANEVIDELADHYSRLSVSGFVDMSYTYVDPDGGSSDSNAGLDQAEIQLAYDFDGKLSVHTDIEWQDNGEGEETHLEQAFINYKFTDQFSAKAGRFLSYSGWETEDPTGLYQYSGTGYAKYFYGGYQQGVSGLYSSDMFSAALSVVADTGDLMGEGDDFSDPAIETMLAFTPLESVTVKGFYLADKNDYTGEDVSMINVWASYAEGPLTLAAEYNTSENTPASVGTVEGFNPALDITDTEADGYLLMANYDFGMAGLTLRYHAWEVESGEGVTVEDVSGFTISPSVPLTDNLLLVLEYRMDTLEADGVEDQDVDSFAIEALLTF
ncbi:outer membrane beta-barrel protein [Echinimonas agarilytica]|uniref:Porin n=1 Tax=Echinimonas agarilytica TaxID=1215918 RepID=A0AA41W5A3_9GAMM|nr:outer membrane beta-barrel protein [Echinimonas agarilytica]MCM2679171.1 porin [Echinimonas agarilytica]